MVTERNQIKKSLQDSFPKLAEEILDVDPVTVSPWSKKKVRWRCTKGHEWFASPESRTHSKSGCPSCAGSIAIPGENDLLTVRPDLARQAFGWDPSTVTSKSGRKLDWKCDDGHIWNTAVSNRWKSGCPFCSGRRLLVGFNDLATTYPEIAAELVGVDPKTITGGTHQTRNWRCKLGHEWKNSVKNRTSQNQGCPFCVGKSVWAGFNDLATTHPELAHELVSDDPTKLSYGAEMKLKWRCPLGHFYETSPNHRTQGNGCPYCAGKRVLVGFNDLQTTDPEKAKFLIETDSRSISRGSNKNCKWKCDLGHDWLATPAAVVRSVNSGCPYCVGAKVWKGFNDLKTTHPEHASLAFGWNPEQYSAGANVKKAWKCRRGHIWRASINSVTQRISEFKGCPYCSGQKVLSGENDLATTHPEIAKRAFGWNPSTQMAGSNRKVKWKCLEGHIWSASINSVVNTTSKSGGCPSCARSGYNQTEKGYLYLLVQNEWEMYQIGITNKPEDRLGRHARLGWEILEVRGPMDGLLAQQWETAILRMLKALGADLGNENIVGRFDGFTESWSKSKFEAVSLSDLMRRTEVFEEKM